jgi:hypothetical protein
MKVCAGSWLICLVCIERMTAMSSACLAILGRMLEISMPDLPCREKSCCAPMQLSALPWSCASCWPRVNDSGIGLPCSSRSFGLKSKVSRWDGPPAMLRKMTRFTLGGSVGAGGFEMPAPSSRLRAIEPRPVSPWPRKVRRLDGWNMGVGGSAVVRDPSVAGDGFVEIEDGAGQRGGGGELNRRDFLRGGRRADG